MKELIMNLDYEMFLCFIVAAVLGLMIGLERELKRKSILLNMILFISIVCFFLNIIFIHSSFICLMIIYEIESCDNSMDILSIDSKIFYGVEFIVTVVIIIRDDDTVSELTTATIVLRATGIRVSIIAGFYAEAITGVVLLLVSIEVI